ncbi:hypothetical protein HYPSUDRAFT_206930 [Hypholoma sublateritium FD-334 SS-4]|uniref:Uncharacterized protein n=1 Tax=Hypholoma sublateritium (strain FD-334 SS-4) TaxID=945553 RepID=A0A0D2KPH4_HYPSF|nr:hypothetical protein HYPSUDRAFT_206930 [Hypholoma sublateritium FD-334 SS-4]
MLSSTPPRHARFSSHSSPTSFNSCPFYKHRWYRTLELCAPPARELQVPPPPPHAHRRPGRESARAHARAASSSSISLQTTCSLKQRTDRHCLDAFDTFVLTLGRT